MYIINTKIFNFFICAIIATTLALTSHIYLQVYVSPILESITKGVNVNPDPSNYSVLIYYSAYITAFITTGFLVFLYYHTQHIIPGKSKLIKALYLTLIILIIKGDARQLVMNIILYYDIGMTNPFILASLQELDPWVANFLLALSLVFLCPKKNA